MIQLDISGIEERETPPLETPVLVAADAAAA